MFGMVLMIYLVHVWNVEGGTKGFRAVRNTNSPKRSGPYELLLWKLTIISSSRFPGPRPSPSLVDSLSRINSPATAARPRQARPSPPIGCRSSPSRALPFRRRFTTPLFDGD
ncbi:unnamed protein product [Citrullus colocynthis]|uniref:Uncharacterized protein n=1 Tax=Citrullus colocynthis TaxID=252529 RepID=A0ABP0Y6C6_9ROSI